MRLLASILKRSVTILGVTALAGATLYLDASSTGYTFSTKGVDLKIASRSVYNGVSVPSATWSAKDLHPTADKFFNFDDVKPGDFGCNVISMHVKNTDAWMCIDFKNLQSDENIQTEPEWEYDHDGDNGGELAAGTEFFGWIDDGNGKYEPKKKEKVLFGTSTNAASVVLDDTTYTVGDAKGGNSCKPNTTTYVGMCWCAGNLSVNAKTGIMQCDGSELDNGAQTDTFSVDVSIRALPTKDSPKYLCSQDKPKKDKKKKDYKSDDSHRDWSGHSWNPPAPPAYSMYGVNWYTKKK